MHRHRLSTGFIKFNPRGCIGCWRCIKSCQHQIIGKVGFLWHKHAVILNPDACIGCGKCISACPRKCFTRNI